MTQSAIVYLVGTGPGDPELITVKALRLIRCADVVIYDRLVSDEILEFIPPDASRIYVGKKSGEHTLSQDEINQLLIKLANRKRTIVRLKGGDPFIFGRGSEEAQILAQHGIAFEVIPGITAASACASYAGIPLTHRGLAQGVQIVTGHSQAGTPLELDWQGLADDNKTIVIYMGLANINLICRKLIEAGLDENTPAAIIQNGTTPRQKCILTTLLQLTSVARFTIKQPPVIFIIGKVVSLAHSLDWFSPLDLTTLNLSEQSNYLRVTKKQQA